MLTQLTIQNFVIVDHLSVSFESGMTVLTGETGAGKSILIDAIELALGKRASAQSIRPGAKQASITLEFQVDDPALTAYLREHGLEEDTCLIQRTLYQDGHSKSLVNGTPVTLSVVKDIASFLINIHGQHEFQNLLKSTEQRQLLDTYAPSPFLPKIAQAFSSWKNAEKAYLDFENISKQAAAQTDLLQFKIQELEKLNLQDHEWEILSEQQKQMAHAEEIRSEEALVSELLRGDQGVIRHLSKVLPHVAKLVQFYPALAASQEGLESALIQIEEAENDIRHTLETIEFEPEQLQKVENRLSLAHQLSRKYHVLPSELSALLKTTRAELENLSGGENRLSQLKQAMDHAKAEYDACAVKLRADRQKAATKFSQAIVENMVKLSMPKSRFVIEVLPAAPSIHGSDDIQFLVSTNPGQAPGSLQSVASGGELSRISLAIEVILATQKTLPVLIFDEVDVGVDATTAKVVGEMLNQLGKKAQVFCITHQASVAGAARHHFYIQKSFSKTATHTDLRRLNSEERLLEIVRMMGGDVKDPIALTHAQAFLLYS